MSFSLSAAGMDRPSTIMLCRVVPGIGFKVIRVFSASARTRDSSAFSGKPLPGPARDRGARARHGVGTRGEQACLEASRTVEPCELGVLSAANKTWLPVDIALTTFYSLSHMVYSNRDG